MGSNTPTRHAKPTPTTRIAPGKHCTPEYRKILKLQIDAFKAVQRLTRTQGEKLCATLESVDRSGVEQFLDPKALKPLLTPRQREWLGALGVDLSRVDITKMMRLLGIDTSQIDVRQSKDHCRASQGELDLFAGRELNTVEGEVLRCDDRV